MANDTPDPIRKEKTDYGDRLIRIPRWVIETIVEKCDGRGNMNEIALMLQPYLESQERES